MEEVTRNLGNSLHEHRQALAQTLPPEVADAVFRVFADGNFFSPVTTLAIAEKVRDLLKQHGIENSEQDPLWKSFYSVLIAATMFLNPQEILDALLDSENKTLP